LVFVTGTGRPGHPEDIVTVAYDAGDGSEVWTAAQDGPINGYEGATGIVASENTVYVAGTLQVDDTFDSEKYNSVLIAYDANTGSRQWIAEYTVPAGSTYSRDLTAGETAIYVTGSVSGGDVGAGSLFTVAYDENTGTQRWAARALSFRGGDSIAVSSEGGTVFVGGRSPTARRHRILAYSAADGSRLWMHSTGQSEFPDDVDVVASPTSDTVYLSGNGLLHRSHGYADHYLVVALDATTGMVDWRARYVNPKGRLDNPVAIAITADGTQLFITGGTQERTYHYSVATVAFDAETGTRLWGGIYGRQQGGDHYAAAIAADPGGDGVYVTGESETTSGWGDFVTVKYSTT
jgi:outer membrane protein assembly factor BamB